MGHLVSATAMRIGVTTTWVDDWFSNKYYYSLYLYSMFRIRHYCVWAFNDHAYFKKSIFYSHFTINQANRTCHLFIYYYDGLFEQRFDDMKFYYFYRWYTNPRNQDPETSIPFHITTFFKIWYFIVVLTNILPLKNRILAKMQRRFNYLFSKWEIMEVLSYLKRHLYSECKLWSKDKRLEYDLRKRLIRKRKRMKKPFIIILFISIAIYVNMKKIMIRTSASTNAGRNVILRKYISILYYMFYYGAGLDNTLLKFNYLSQKFSYFLSSKTHICILNNHTVTAKFLSRYIARKIQQGYSIKQIFSPIRKELFFLFNEGAGSRWTYFSKKAGKFIENKWNFWSKHLYYSLIINIMNIYNKINGLYIEKEKMLFSIDQISIYRWIMQKKEGIKEKNKKKRGKNYIRKSII